MRTSISTSYNIMYTCTSILLLLLVLTCTCITHTHGQNIKSPGATPYLDDDNWDKILSGEWMIEFMAPWCPACNSLESTWNKLHLKSRELGVKVAAVDVTMSPCLTGRFLVTALPTIYHVINGEFRKYSGSRNLDSFVNFVAQSQWRSIEPISYWKSPVRFHMSIVGQIFKFSHVLRNINHVLHDEYGIPTPAVYVIFAVVIIFIGAFLGLVGVCLLDLLYPVSSKNKNRSPLPTETVPLIDDIVDENEENDNEEDDDAELNSESDTPQSSEDESEKVKEETKKKK